MIKELEEFLEAMDERRKKLRNEILNDIVSAAGSGFMYSCD